MNFLEALALAVSVVVVAAIFSSFGKYTQSESIKRQAVEVGVAEYYLDQNHDHQWRWITNSTP